MIITYNLNDKMSSGDYFNQLKGKVHELKVRRDGINQEVLRDRIGQTSLDEQIAQLERQRQRMRMEIE